MGVEKIRNVVSRFYDTAAKKTKIKTQPLVTKSERKS